MTSQGYRLLRLWGYSVSGQDYDASIWDMSPGPAWVGMHRVSGGDYQAQFNQLTAQGFRPVDISGYELNSGDAYTAIVEQSDAPGWSAHHGVPGGDYQGLFDENVANRLRPVRVSGYTVGGGDYVASIWIGDDGSGWSAVHGADNATYQRQFDEATSPYWIAHHNLSADAYQRAFEENGASGCTLPHIAGRGRPDRQHLEADHGHRGRATGREWRADA